MCLPTDAKDDPPGIAVLRHVHPGLVEDTWDFDDIYLMKNGNTNLEEVLSFYSFDTCHDFLIKYIW